MRTLCVTLGDPCGLGPELVARHFAETGAPTAERVLVVGPEKPLRRELERIGAPLTFGRVAPGEVLPDRAGLYLLEPPELAGMDFTLGEPTEAGGLAAGVSLDAAARLVLDGKAQALVTCPLNKAMLQQAGFAFSGHTEFLADRAGVGADKVCMHLCGHDPDDPAAPMLRVSLVTTHPALRDVAGLITGERILNCLRLTAEFLGRLGLAGPVAVCGLNPHAGESGRIGDEEITTIIPALEQARRGGLDVVGPLPADTVFHFAAQGQYPAVLAMYHDQGLGPLKLLHFSRAVNVTLGLPFVRTSPDHGTGYDLVGTGKASVQSFRAALDMARRLAGGR
ncbi:4-hydroxythreonine-4-phosphate dehydrogenase PdxA [Pseudodesulfovibrio sp.]|uniref:4-hydroxythreonine-4-phosphate dehydrogenase PdxA n=1 Tax=Pseudodesulfovibrio sp. TaxID=2035812 RepID=UPI00260DC20D|nr:4-hydroxythreonine-4-phosphate dehydrogenase PdxA [Pseudodesulfovibrio sp.]MDD3313442.1 4-hydroxythreonine-4-phosphate dehydrogenase PdxA [Pseudodesulfovibrio sp.]